MKLDVHRHVRTDGNAGVGRSNGTGQADALKPSQDSVPTTTTAQKTIETPLSKDETKNVAKRGHVETHATTKTLIAEKTGLPAEAKELADALGLGKAKNGPGEKTAALKKLVARFGPIREPGVEVFTFEKGAVYKEKNGATWRPVPDLKKPVEYEGLSVKKEAAKKAAGEKTWAHADNLPRADVDKLVSTMRSHTGPIKTDPDTGLPLNPLGKTGVTGRGESNYGPILAQDILLHAKDPKTGKTFAVFIERKDTGRWAMPGGIEDAKDKGAKVPTAIRELVEETGVKGKNGEDVLPDIMKAFEKAQQTFQGVCAKEPRNTDNMWFETTVFSVEIPWDLARGLALEGSDDAKGAALKEVTPELVASLHGDHPDFVGTALGMK